MDKYRKFAGVAACLLVAACSGVNWFPESTNGNSNGSFTNNSSSFTNNSSAFPNRSSAFSNTSTAGAPQAVTADSTGVVNVADSSFQYWAQSDTEVTVKVLLRTTTSDGATHSAAVYFSAVDSDGNEVYSSNTGAFPSPNQLQTTVRVSLSDYPRIQRWIITKVTRYT